MNSLGTNIAALQRQWRKRYGIDAPMRLKGTDDVFVQACRPEDRAMLQTSAGKELIEAAVDAMRERGAS